MKSSPSKYNNIHFSLILCIGFCLSLLLVRIKLTHSPFYGFLVWNLFLAAIPYFITEFMKYHRGWRNSRFQRTALFAGWLLFLPNSPYIITDLIHLHNENSVLIWLDLFLVFVFALNGLLFGLLSLLDMFRFISERYSRGLSLLVIFNICLLCGYGIYLGRFLRFNSWDILTRPAHLLSKISGSLTEPKVWAMTFAFGGLLWILFGLLRSIFVGLYEQKI